MIEAHLHEYHCYNQRCPSVQRGHPRVILVGCYGPGTVAQSLPCPCCGWRTWVIITTEGRVRYEARRG